MAKVFISQPMSGKNIKEIQAERKRLNVMAKAIFDGDAQIINSIIKPSEIPKEANPLWFLGKSIEIMSKADAVVFAKGWQNNRGCRIEHTCAHDYGIRIIEL